MFHVYRWSKGQPIITYSTSQQIWCVGEIKSLFRDSKGTVLDLRYWHGTTSKAKYVDLGSNSVQPIPGVSYIF